MLGLKSIENTHEDSVWAATWVPATKDRPALLLTGSLDETVKLRRADEMAKRACNQMRFVAMAPEEEKLTRRNPLDFPIAWFRELPRGVLDPLPSEQVMQCESDEDFVKMADPLTALMYAVQVMKLLKTVSTSDSKGVDGVVQPLICKPNHIGNK